MVRCCRRRIGDAPSTKSAAMSCVNSKAAANLNHADLCCPICFELFVDAQTTACGHAFCRRCLDELVLYSRQCPLCRGPTGGHSHLPSLELRKIVEKIVEAEAPAVRRSWVDHVGDNQQWEEGRRVQPVVVGQKIDVMDGDSVWCVAVVKEVHQNERHARTLLVHYEGWDGANDEFICENSPRLARLGFYTSRADVPKHSFDEVSMRQTRFRYLIVGRPIGRMFLRNFDILEMIPTLRFRNPPAQDPEPESES